MKMTRQEAIKGLKVLRRDFSGYKPNEEMFDMAIEALQQEEIIKCKDCVKWCKGDDLYGICNWNEYRTLRTTKDSFCSYGKRESDGE